MKETGRRSKLIALVVSELRGLNAEFESDESAAERIVNLVERHLGQPNVEFVF